MKKLFKSKFIISLLTSTFVLATGTLGFNKVNSSFAMQNKAKITNEQDQQNIDNLKDKAYYAVYGKHLQDEGLSYDDIVTENMPNGAIKFSFKNKKIIHENGKIDNILNCLLSGNRGFTTVNYKDSEKSTELEKVHSEDSKMKTKVKETDNGWIVSCSVNEDDDDLEETAQVDYENNKKKSNNVVSDSSGVYQPYSESQFYLYNDNMLKGKAYFNAFGRSLDEDGYTCDDVIMKEKWDGTINFYLNGKLINVKSSNPFEGFEKKFDGELEEEALMKKNNIAVSFDFPSDLI